MVFGIGVLQQEVLACDMRLDRVVGQHVAEVAELVMGCRRDAVTLKTLISRKWTMVYQCSYPMPRVSEICWVAPPLLQFAKTRSTYALGSLGKVR